MSDVMTWGASADALDLALLMLRVTFGVLISLHGFQKLFGWFGGGGLAGTAGWFSSLGFAGRGRVAAVMAGGSEVGGGLGLALGLLTPLAASAVIGVMVVAAIVNASSGGFWSVSKGWELNLYLMLAAWFLAVAGPGRFSVDRALDWDLAGLPLGTGAALLGLVGGLAVWKGRARLG